MAKISVRVIGLASLGLAGAALAPATAAATGETLLRAGAVQVAPTASDTGLESGLGLEVNVSNLVTEQWGFELDAAVARQDLRQGSFGSGDVKVVPLTASVQYHFPPNGPVRPYVGAGFNVTLFADEHLELCGRCTFDASAGFAAQFGVDFAAGRSFFVNAAVRYVRGDTALSNQGRQLSETANINPLVYSLMVGWKFDGTN
jgi:outer membrane protein